MNLIENWLTTNKKNCIHICQVIFSVIPETAYQETYSSKRWRTSGNAGIPGNLENSWYRHCIYRCLGFRQANGLDFWQNTMHCRRSVTPADITFSELRSALLPALSKKI